MPHYYPTTALWALLLLPGCAALNAPPPLDMPDTAPLPASAIASSAAQPATTADTTAATGSLYHAASYHPAYENRRARQVGDLVTVHIAERVSASQKSDSQLARGGGMHAGVSALPLLGTQANARLGERLQLGLDSETRFKGAGGTSSDNTFSGSISATVTEVLPNGHLRVRGEKQIGLNHNVDVLRFSGTLDPRNLRPGNTVASTQLADVRVQARSLGQTSALHSMGWLARFFSSVALF